MTYDTVGNHFRKLWGQEAGWAHSVLFTADLRSFADRLAATKKVEVTVKGIKEEVGIKTEVTAPVAFPTPEGDDGIDVKGENSDTNPNTKGTRGTKRRGTLDGIVHASQTTKARRVSTRSRR